VYYLSFSIICYTFPVNKDVYNLNTIGEVENETTFD